MDILTFQSKRFGRVPVVSEKRPEHPFSVLLQGGAFWIREPQAIAFLSEQGKYGHRMGERQNNVNPDVFSNEPDSVREYWSSKIPSIESIELSYEEVFYLFYKKRWIAVYEENQILSEADLWSVLNNEKGSMFAEKVIVYSKLRELGWCVRSGLTYGCQYLIYKESPCNYHASAGVFIKNSLKPNHLVSLTRALTNVKKAVIVATVTIPSDLVDITLTDLHQIDVQFITANTFFPERNENRDVS